MSNLEQEAGPREEAGAASTTDAAAGPITPAVLRPKGGAQYLGVSVATFWRLTREKDFPTLFKLRGNSTAVMREELDAWLKAKREGK